MAAYTLIYHPAVRQDDLPLIDRKMRERIRRAIEERLQQDPIQCGAPLRRSLHGYRKLRVGDYRIVYEIVGTAIHVYIIAHRREVYGAVAKRLE